MEFSQSNGLPAIAKRLWHMVRVVYYMLRKGISKRKIMMDLHLLLKRGKIAGKALGNLMTFHHHHHHHHHGGVGGLYSSFSCRSMDPNLSFYTPKEVEFSCSNTPSFPSFHVSSKRRRAHHGGYSYDYDAAAIARAFEILSAAGDASEADSVAPSPSPAPSWGFGRSPMPVRQLRITDSPFPIKEEEGEADCHVDSEAEEFIKRFYEQLRLQQRAAATPEYRRRRGSVPGRT